MLASPGYHSPQIVRKELIPLAEKFLTGSSADSPVEEFISYVINQKSPTCRKSNIGIWRKDAIKALRLINGRKMVKTHIEGESSIPDKNENYHDEPPQKRMKISMARTFYPFSQQD
ncbi:unnamed protein product [Protopolystoma xenopodis]|uniref:Uncharacterized protein n=1 Tax=Protopolystoma xenopodis TaxID=117903 RepID=A0A448X4H2_9PLAT|nr:unnamed protein product [Protopolystoma xenopodis]